MRWLNNEAMKGGQAEYELTLASHGAGVAALIVLMVLAGPVDFLGFLDWRDWLDALVFGAGIVCGFAWLLDSARDWLACVLTTGCALLARAIGRITLGVGVYIVVWHPPDWPRWLGS